MPMVKMFQYQEASPEARAVFDDIMATRKIDWVFTPTPRLRVPRA